MGLCEEVTPYIDRIFSALSAFAYTISLPSTFNSLSSASSFTMFSKKSNCKSMENEQSNYTLLKYILLKIHILQDFVKSFFLMFDYVSEICQCDFHTQRQEQVLDMLSYLQTVLFCFWVGEYHFLYTFDIIFCHPDTADSGLFNIGSNSSCPDEIIRLQLEEI